MVRRPSPAAPWYVHPLEDPDCWHRIRAEHPLAFAVVNVHNGPGPRPDDTYRSALDPASRTPWVGYIDLDYGRVPRSQVLDQARSWSEWYGVEQFFLDQVPSVASQGVWSLDLVAELRDEGARGIVLNPGTVPHPAVFFAGDVTCVFEGTLLDYVRARFPAWLAEADPSRRWDLVHSCWPGSHGWARALAGRRGAGYVWTTSGRLPHPWCEIPGRW